MRIFILLSIFFLIITPPPRSTLFPYTTLFRSVNEKIAGFGVRIGTSTPEQFDALMRAEYEKRSEEHTSELQSRQYLVCRLLLEKKKTRTARTTNTGTRVHTTRA